MFTQKQPYQEIADQLAAYVLGGHFQPGARLPSEQTLAENFNSRTDTVKEALVALNLAGIIDISLKNGVRVAIRLPAQHPNFIQQYGPGPLELLQARIIIEPEIAALAATTITAEDLSELEMLNNQYLQSMDNQPVSRSFDEAFHLKLARASNNNMLYDVLAGIFKTRNEMPMWLRYVSIMDMVYGQMSYVNFVKRRNHKRLIACLREHNPEESRLVMREHLQAALEALQKGSWFDLEEAANSS